MMKFAWNALVVGDNVLMHDPRYPEAGLIDGVVTMVDARKGINGVGIRVATPEGRQILWPSYLAVHSVPRDPADSCWRCEALATDRRVQADLVKQV